MEHPSYNIPTRNRAIRPAESPANTPDEMDKKRALYFERGAVEVWLCSWEGNMTFYGTEGKPKPSEFCATFPDTIVL
jgi:hypothetical protein